jgi:SAM-dependent methyltransferase
MTFSNAYADQSRAEAYASLEFPGTYYLAYRDLPSIIGSAAPNATALDFGCGAGRSSRFLRTLGYTVTGVDISAEMLSHARRIDPDGDYRQLPDGSLDALGDAQYDVIFASFTFDNIPGWDHRVGLFRAFAERLRPNGRVINLASAPEMYEHEWLSFSTREFAENRTAQTGDIVRTIMLDGNDQRPIHDVYWSADDYLELYRRAGLTVHNIHRPLGTPADNQPWVNEERVSPWSIYELGKATAS